MRPVTPIVLVLLPGMDGTGALFAPFLRELPDWVTPIVVSYPPDQPLDYPGHLDIVMAALPTDQPFVLLGESFSGPLALMAAARQPRGLQGVILCATFITWPLLLPRGVARLLVSVGAFQLKSQRSFIRLLLGKKASTELRSLFTGALVRLTPEVLATRAKAVMIVDCTSELGACRVPLLVMVADHDRIVAKRCPGLIQRIRPDATIRHFNSSHLILQCATFEACQQIGLFLGELSDDSLHLRH